MPLKSFVDEARKTNALMEKMRNQENHSSENIIDISDGQNIPQKQLEKIQEQNKSTFSKPITQNKNYNNFEKNYIKKNENYSFPKTNNGCTQKIDERHNNIIANIIQKSNTSTGNTTWENCKHKKECNGTIYCKEFMSLCGKEKCNRATR